jgi:O-Antigen ligase
MPRPTRSHNSPVQAGPPDGRRMDTLGPLFWTRAVAALTLGVFVAIWSPSYYVTVAAAVALPVVMGRYALATVAFFAITAREAPGGRGFDYVTTLGSQIYYQGKIPAINFLAVSAILVAVVRLRRRGDRLLVRRAAWLLLGCLGALALLAFVLGIIYGQSVFSAANQNSRNFVVAAIGIVIGLLIMEFPEEIRAVKLAAVSGLGLLVVAAVFAVATGQAADDRVSRYFTYYDSALPAVATAVLGALLVSRSRLTWPAGLAMGLSLTLVLIGFRLTIWLATFVVLAFAVLLSREWTAIARRSAVSALALVACVLVLPGMRSDITSRVLGASSAAPAVSMTAPTSTTATPRGSAPPKETATPGGSAPPKETATPGGSAPPKETATPGRSAPAKEHVGEKAVGHDVAAESSQGHLQDIRIAWSYVRENFWTGIGPQHPQLPGLASDKTHVLYVHNEWLQDWLRFGPGAVVLVTAFLLIIALLAIRTLAGRKAPAMHRAAAIFGLITPICLLAFPYLSESIQWPLLLGIAAGILAARSKETDEESPKRKARHAAGMGNRQASLPLRGVNHEVDTVVIPAVGEAGN